METFSATTYVANYVFSIDEVFIIFKSPWMCMHLLPTIFILLCFLYSYTYNYWSALLVYLMCISFTSKYATNFINAQYIL